MDIKLDLHTGYNIIVLLRTLLLRKNLIIGRLQCDFGLIRLTVNAMGGMLVYSSPKMYSSYKLISAVVGLISNLCSKHVDFVSLSKARFPASNAVQALRDRKQEVSCAVTKTIHQISGVQRHPRRRKMSH